MAAAADESTNTPFSPFFCLGLFLFLALPDFEDFFDFFFGADSKTSSVGKDSPIIIHQRKFKINKFKGLLRKYNEQLYRQKLLVEIFGP